MRAAFALLADYSTHNIVRKLAWQMYQQYGISLEISRLPPHVSLKQPFEITDISALEDYMEEFAVSLAPIDFTLTKLEMVEIIGSDGPTGILWLQAEQTPALCRLHTRLNQELASHFSNTRLTLTDRDTSST